MEEITRQIPNDDHPDCRNPFRVALTVCGNFGVFADSVLIAAYVDQGEAELHCERLRRQQIEDLAVSEGERKSSCVKGTPASQ